MSSKKEQCSLFRRDSLSARGCSARASRILVAYGFLLPSLTRDLDFLCGRKATTTACPDQWWLWSGEACRCRTDWPTRTPEQSTHCHCVPANDIIRCVGDCGGLGLSIPFARPKIPKMGMSLRGIGPCFIQGLAWQGIHPGAGRASFHHFKKGSSCAAWVR